MRTCLLRRVPSLILALVCCLSLLPGRAETYPLKGEAESEAEWLEMM